jgi:hypothetical protein
MVCEVRACEALVQLPREIAALREALVEALNHADECTRAAAEEHASRARAVEEAARDANLSRDALVAAVRAVAARTRERARPLYRPTKPIKQYGPFAVAMILDAVADDIEIAIGDQPKPRTRATT